MTRGIFSENLIKGGEVADSPMQRDRQMQGIACAQPRCGILAEFARAAIVVFAGLYHWGKARGECVDIGNHGSLSYAVDLSATQLDGQSTFTLQQRPRGEYQVAPL